MKQFTTGGGGGGGGGGLRLPTESEVEVSEILLTLPKRFAKLELLSRYSFTWGRKKKRSVLVSKSESSPSPSNSTQPPPIVVNTPEKYTPGEPEKSPSTPLCFLSSGSDGAGKRKPPPPSVKKNSKRKATDDLMQSCILLQREREMILRETEAVKTLRRQLTSMNLELKAIRQKMKYSRNMEVFQEWNNSIKTKEKHATAFIPPTPQQQLQYLQQAMVDRNNWHSGNSHGGGGFAMFSPIDPHVKIHNFMASSQALDQSKYVVVDDDLQVRSAAAEARKRRKLRMKESKNAMKPPRRWR